jgi:hypothetical protein
MKQIQNLHNKRFIHALTFLFIQSIVIFALLKGAKKLEWNLLLESNQNICLITRISLSLI